MLLMHWASRLHRASWGRFESDLLLVNTLCANESETLSPQ